MTMIVAHRGASAAAPENTLPAFARAWELGVAAVEGDFHLTRDGHLICLHDRDTARVAGIRKVVAATTLAELRELDVGSWRGEAWRGTCIPTLREVLATVPATGKIFLEVKCGPEILPLMQEELQAAELKPEQVVLISFSQAVLRVAATLGIGGRRSWLSGLRRDPDGTVRPTVEEVLQALSECGATGFSSAHELVDEERIREVQAANCEYHVWTVDDPAAARRLRDWGVQSITTNDPEQLLKVV